MSIALAPTETITETTRDGTSYLQARKTVCKLCRAETLQGHAVTVCVFALMKKLSYLEDKLLKMEQSGHSPSNKAMAKR